MRKVDTLFDYVFSIKPSGFIKVFLGDETVLVNGWEISIDFLTTKFYFVWDNIFWNLATVVEEKFGEIVLYFGCTDSQEYARFSDYIDSWGKVDMEKILEIVKKDFLLMLERRSIKSQSDLDKVYKNYENRV